jgi:multicomponent Na+:H+ antiporter subunit D
LVKLIYRVVGFEYVVDSHIFDVIFIFGLCGMIFGSVNAIWEKDIRRMIAFSSVAQIGYIYMGFGLGTEEGMIASLFHILMHGASKALLFIAVIGLTDVSGKSRDFFSLTGAAYRNKVAGVGFLVGSLSVVGIPVFAGFVSKLMFAEAAVQATPIKMFPTLVVLALSTILNAIYFLKTVLRIYTPEKTEVEEAKGFSRIEWKSQKLYTVAIILFILLNIVLGTNSKPILELITEGLHNFM